MLNYKQTNPIAPKHNLLLVITVVALVGAVISYTVLNRDISSMAFKAKDMLPLLLLNLGIILLLVAILTPRIAEAWKHVKYQNTKKSLKRRIIKTFSIIAILPTLIVSLFSVLFFNLGIQAWFNERVNTAVVESLAVAEAYLYEHKENIRADALALSNELNQLAHLALVNPVEFNRIVSAQASQRQITEVIVFQKNRIIAQGRLSFSLAFESLPLNAIEKASEGNVVILNTDTDKIRALVKLDALDNTYLLVGRLVDNDVLAHLNKTKGAVSEYQRLKGQLSNLQTAFSLIFFSLTLLLLCAAIYYGLIFTARITNPIAKLAHSAERVRAGDYSVKLEVGSGEDEIALLGKTFNRMTEQLDSQRNALFEANRSLDERRRFSEAVLRGVSAGVVAINDKKLIKLLNRSAHKILGMEENDTHYLNKPLTDILPEIQELLEHITEEKEDSVQGTITIQKDAIPISLMLRITSEKVDETVIGYIVTFDDITPLVSAQRQAAWSDVARRVAHEIKNPLTPITLSTDRIRKKFGAYVPDGEQANFNRYTDTILRHVEDIGKMVEEFVSFARMPRAKLTMQPLVPIIKKAIFSEELAAENIEYSFNTTNNHIKIACDEGQLMQIMTNLLKNAAQAIHSKQDEVGAHKGKIAVSIEECEKDVKVIVTDNGPGFISDKTDEMIKPYITTKEKGMGLGLAITRKIMDEHKGTITLENNPSGGAIVTLSFLSQCDIKVS